MIHPYTTSRYSSIVILVLLMSLVSCNAFVTPTTVVNMTTLTVENSSSEAVQPSPTAIAYIPIASLAPPAATSFPPTYPSLPTFTPAPTLTSVQKKDFVVSLLKNNGGCELPCWWGITPGQTAWQTAKDVFTAQGVKWYNENELHFDPPLSERPNRYRIDIYMTRQGEKVQSLKVDSEVFGDPRSNQFAQDWHRYSLDQILAHYGRPSQVQIDLTNACPEPNCGPVPYDLFVFYDHLGILIRYQGSAIRGDPIVACPKFNQLEYMNLWLQSPGQVGSLLQNANLDPSEQSHMRLLSETTGMSLDDFYNKFKEPNTKMCITSPADFWK